MNLPKIQFKNQKPEYLKFAQDIDFFELFKKIETEYNNCYFLESLGEEGDRSRYSIIGFEPESIISARENILNISGKEYQVDNPYFALRQIVPQNVITRHYAGGLVGYLAYDCVNYFEEVMNVSLHPDFEQFIFGVYKDGLVYDKITGETFYFYFDNSRIDEIQAINEKSEDASKQVSIEELGHSKSEQEHSSMIKRVKDDIINGKIFQCVVGFKTEYKIQGDKILIYEELRKVNPSPHMYYLKFGEKVIIGASPELLFRLQENEMETYPLAGTIKRGQTSEDDQILARQLLNDPKEIAEHSMLVDLHRNDIGRVAKFGTVKVKNLMNIKKFSHVQHISSEISGFIKEGEDMFSSLASNFPAGTLSGAPKIEAMKIIEREEQLARGPYGGAVGHFGFNGECTFAIPIRSLFVAGSYGYAQTAGGIVHDSESNNEYNEIIKKLGAMEKTLSNLSKQL